MRPTRIRARVLVEQLLADTLPRRWAHTQGVGTKAETVAHVLGDGADLLIGAAWLHDLGYWPTAAATRFHPLDGARYLRDIERADERLCRLVARHSVPLSRRAIVASTRCKRI